MKVYVTISDAILQFPPPDGTWYLVVEVEDDEPTYGGSIDLLRYAADKAVRAWRESPKS